MIFYQHRHSLFPGIHDLLMAAERVNYPLELRVQVDLPGKLGVACKVEDESPAGLVTIPGSDHARIGIISLCDFEGLEN